MNKLLGKSNNEDDTRPCGDQESPNNQDDNGDEKSNKPQMFYGVYYPHDIDAVDGPGRLHHFILQLLLKFWK